MKSVESLMIPVPTNWSFVLGDVNIGLESYVEYMGKKSKQSTVL